MHELLAPIIYIHEIEKVPCRDDQRLYDDVSMIMDSDFVEHDSFALFSKLMQYTIAWYNSGEHLHETPEQQAQRKQAFQEPFIRHDPHDNDTVSIISKCRNVQNNLLYRVDPTLCDCLKNYGIEPHIYALRWFRLLLAREFSMQQTLILWDCIFSDSRDLNLLDYICVAMLMHIRDELLSRDYTGCLQLLLHFPEETDCIQFVEHAIRIRNEIKMGSRPPTNSSSSTPVWKTILAPLARTTVNFPYQSKLQEQLKQTLDLQKRMGQRLNDIIENLQKELLQEQRNADNTYLLLVQLKIIKDILSGNLPDDSVLQQMDLENQKNTIDAKRTRFEIFWRFS